MSQESWWTETRERAAALIADGTPSNEQIAADLQMNRKTLERWCKHPEFMARVAEHVEKRRQAVMSQGIADRVERIKRLNRDWERLQQVQEARSKAVDPDDPLKDPLGLGAPGFIAGALASGMTSGNVVVEWVTTPRGAFKPQFKVDTATLSELRQIEKQAAQELGQWTEKQTTETTGTVTVHVVYDDPDPSANYSPAPPP